MSDPYEDISDLLDQDAEEYADVEEVSLEEEPDVVEPDEELNTEDGWPYPDYN